MNRLLKITTYDYDTEETREVIVSADHVVEVRNSGGEKRYRVIVTLHGGCHYVKESIDEIMDLLTNAGKEEAK